MQQKLLNETFKMVSKRQSYMCNFIEGTGTSWGKNTKLIYRHYATLYFIFVVDDTESELGILDLIQTFVESLDRVFRNVCELDLILHVDRVSPFSIAITFTRRFSFFRTLDLAFGECQINFVIISCKHIIIN
jgi:hypothetical protein